MGTIVIIGLGQLGRVFAGGFLRAGYSVVPVNRSDDMDSVAARHPSPELVLVAVAEPDLHTVLCSVPAAWKQRLVLLQNELLPRDWQLYLIANPTVVSVWFEKKKGTDAKPLLPSPVFGPAAKVVLDALLAVEIPAVEVSSEGELLYELVRKNIYILTTNIAGLKTGGNVGELWHAHRALATEIAQEVMDIQDWLTNTRNSRERLLGGLEEAIQADPAHGCTGRSAPARLARNLKFADEAGLAVPKLREIQASLS